MNGKYNKRQPQDTDRPLIRPRLTREQRVQMLACIMADRGLFVAARAHLKPEHFDQPDEAAQRILWVTVLRVAEKSGMEMLFGDRTTAWNILDTETRAEFQAQQAPMQFFDELFHQTAGFLPWTYGICKPSEFSPAYGTALLTDFLRERAINDPLRRLSQSAGENVIANLAAVARQFAQKEMDIVSLNSDPVESGAPNDWAPPPTNKRPTGVVWLDRLLNGGHRGPEVYGVLGAIGSGKTTFALQLAHSVSTQETFLASPEGYSAREAIGLDPSAPYSMGHVYYFHYEMSRDDIRKKMWSHAAMIDLERIERLGTPGFSLSDVDNLSEAERAVLSMAASQLAIPPVGVGSFLNERARLEIAKRTLNTNFWQVNMTGDEVASRGIGEIPEIEAILAGEVAKGRRVAAVIIDYAQACVERHTLDEKKVYSLLSTFGRRCEHQIGVQFGTPVWVLQQLSGVANARSAASRPHHSDAMGTKRFAENCWFGFNIGTADEVTGCRYFTVSKARRADLGRPPVLKIAGGFNRLIDVSNQYQFDGRGRAVLKEKQSGLQPR